MALRGSHVRAIAEATHAFGAPYPRLRGGWRKKPELFRAFASAKKLAHRSLEFLLLELRGDARGVGQVVPGRTVRNLDSFGQVPGRAKELVASTASFSMGSPNGGSDTAVMLSETNIDPIIPTGNGGLFARDGSLWWKNSAGQIKRVA